MSQDGKSNPRSTNSKLANKRAHAKEKSSTKLVPLELKKDEPQAAEGSEGAQNSLQISIIEVSEDVASVPLPKPGPDTKAPQNRYLNAPKKGLAASVLNSQSAGLLRFKPFEEMIHTVDLMFDAFQNLAYETNKIHADTDLELHWIRPSLKQEKLHSWHQTQSSTSVFSGRISTRRWSLVVRGTEEKIAVYILPADKLISFSLNLNSFKPYLELTPCVDKDTFAWSAGEHKLSEEQLSLSFSEVIHALLRFAQDQAHHNETFAFSTIGISGTSPPEAAEEDPEKNTQQKYQQQFFAAMRRNIDKDPPLLGPESIEPKEKRQSKKEISIDEVQLDESGWIKLPSHSESQFKSHKLQAADNNGRAIKHLLNPTFKQLLKKVTASIDQQLDEVSKAGAKAFAKHDLEKADTALKTSSVLTQLRQLAEQILES